MPFQGFIQHQMKMVFKPTLPTEGGEVELLHPDSFLAKYLYPEIDKSYFETETESVINKEEVEWSKLPKIIWL